MNLERAKQLSNEYAEQHIISRGQLEKLIQELPIQQCVVISEPTRKTSTQQYLLTMRK